MLIPVSGVQGSGKTTVINTLSEQGFLTPYKPSSKSIARTIMEDWGVTLAQINADKELQKKFQDENIQRKYKLELGFYGIPQRVYFVERSFADLFAYALIVLGMHNEDSKWLNEYYEKCMEYQQIYSHVFFLKVGYYIDLMHDGVRGSNMHYIHLVDMVTHDITKQITLGNRITTIDSPSMDQRVMIIKNFARSINHERN
ncbi:MAG: AAA family ATPase [Nitrosopumilaceae archaeon]